ncbi:MAG: branched-chain amino acid aminotransferase [Oscillospiraceae bacterium]|nr:branched-chain amino acid aminotransferase [Oscillospiraceae bacterium]
MDTNSIRVTRTANPKPKPLDENELGFGRVFTDHMFIMDYLPEKGWYDPRIIPYQDLSIDPAAMVFHYGQAVFEGLKAYSAEDGRALLFRPDRNMSRVNLSNDRLCIPQIDESFMVEAIKRLVDVDRDWIPKTKCTSLYIRPFIIAIDPFVGVRPSERFWFIIILSPVGCYYPEGLNPVRIYVETEYVRAARGGYGFTKTAGNYSASLKAQQNAKELGYTQVLWLDAVERKYVEEVGTMNVFFKIGGKVITPPLSGTILGGITRESAIELIKSWGVELEERPITIDEVIEAGKSGTLEEAFGTGTAAVISPIGELKRDNYTLTINDNKIGDLSLKLYDELTGIQYGEIADTRGWVFEAPHY